MVKPSDAHVWVNCPGSETLRGIVPALPGDDADARRDEGDAWHDLCAAMLTGQTPLEPSIIDTVAPNGVVIDAEMYDAARLYVEDVRNTSVPLTEESVEATFPCDFIAPGQTCRVDAYEWDGDQLTVWEGKYGYSVVEAFENEQLYINAHAVALAYDIPDSAYVRLRVVQPRAYHGEGPVREWIIRVDALRNEIMNRIVPAAQAALSGTGTCNTGSWCNQCPARRACEALNRACGASLDLQHREPSAIPLSGPNLATELRLLKRGAEYIKSHMTALEKQAEYELRTGTVIPGFTLKSSGRGTLKWADWVTPKDIKELGDTFGVDLGVELGVKLLTPKQATDAFNRSGIDGTVINEYCERIPASAKLTETEDISRIFKGDK